jgi:uncharacterized repeat protein (TIGR03803 family)
LDGSDPNGLVLGTDGYFYGTTQNGGTYGDGTVFRISAAGELTTLHSFTGASDGAYPQAGLVQGSDGYFYGTASQGGLTNLNNGYGFGTVIKITPGGTLASLYSFGTLRDTNNTPLDGAYPRAALVQGVDGYFYGTTDGTVFKLSPSGMLTNLYSFPAPGFMSQTVSAVNGLTSGNDGALYGTTFSIGLGGLHSYGSFFRITTNGEFTALYAFDSWEEGIVPESAAVQGTDGSFYGTTAGLLQGLGTIFRLTLVPEFQAMTLTNGTLNLTWSTEAGGSCQLQASASLNTPNWTNLGSPVAATNATTRFTDAVTNAPQRFYRISLAPSALH